METNLNNSNENNIKSTIDAVTGLAKAIPIYDDALQPAAKEIGKSLATIAMTVNVLLAPLKGLVWGYEKIEDFISTSLSEKLKKIPQEKITTPKPEVAVPIFEALRYSGHNLNLRELYANLLANAMDMNTIDFAHPGFVEILKNISSDEAILLKVFLSKDQYPLLDIRAEIIKDGTGYSVMFVNFSHLSKIVNIERPDLIPNYLDNLCRLGLVVIPALTRITSPNAYVELENDPELDELKNHIEIEMKRRVVFNQKLVKLTTFGLQFVQNVVKDK